MFIFEYSIGKAMKTLPIKAASVAFISDHLIDQWPAGVEIFVNPSDEELAQISSCHERIVCGVDHLVEPTQDPKMVILVGNESWNPLWDRSTCTIWMADASITETILWMANVWAESSCKGYLHPPMSHMQATSDRSFDK